jgi:molecular chaperone GrpE
MTESRTPQEDESTTPAGPTSDEAQREESAGATADAGQQAQTEEDPEKAALERRVAELTDAWQRSVAELENYRKRMARELSMVRAQERAQVAARFLPVIDNLERALSHAQSNSPEIVEGLRAVRQQALDVLASLGFPRREDIGRAFDPTYHEAVSTVADDDLQPGTIAQVLRPGYGADDEVLRPAAVVVAVGG